MSTFEFKACHAATPATETVLPFHNYNLCAESCRPYRSENTSTTSAGNTNVRVIDYWYFF
jgi:hypothetical protein